MSDFNISARTRLLLLTLGAITGLVLASTGLVEHWSLPSSDLPGNVIARVGDHLIPRERYQQLLNDLATDKRTPVSDEDRQFVLDRLIDEELMILRGVELGLPETSPEIRKSIAGAVIMQVVTEAQVSMPADAELRSLYNSDPGFFSSNSRYRVRWWRLNGQGNEILNKAGDAYRQLNSAKEIGSILQSSGFERVSELPDTLLPLSKLIDYMGPVLADQVAALPAGGFTHPVDSDHGMHILYLVEHKAGALASFEDIRAVVETEYQRRQADQALRDYLAWLRKRTEIVIVESKP